MRAVENEEEFRRLRASARQLSLVAQARQGDKEAKRKLLQFNYSCLPNEDGTLKGATRLSNSVGMDIDYTFGPNGTEAEKVRTFAEVAALILQKESDLGLLMLERSASKGLHIVFRRHADMSQTANLQWASQLLGIPHDEGAKDHTRVFFASTASADDLLFVSPDLFDNETVVMDEGNKELRDLGNKENQNSSDSSDSSIPNLPDSSTPDYRNQHPSDYDGIPYRILVDALAEQLGGVPVHGSRNNFLFSMACHLRYVCNDDPQWIESVLPTYGEDAERVGRTIQSACSRAQSRNMPAMVQRAISVARARVTVMGSTANPQHSDMTNPDLQNSAGTPPQMPKRLPRLIQLLVSKVEPMYRPAVAQAVFAPLGAHLHGVTTRYIDNSENDLGGFMSILMAKQSIGKGSVNMPIELVMDDVKERDANSRELEKLWKAQCKQAKANEKKPARPAGLCVQYLMSNMTNAALVQRLMDAESAGGKYLYVKFDEIELLDQIKASGGATASEIIRLAFTQSLYGQERVGHESVCGTPPLRFNFNASTTVPSGQKYFRGGLTNGTLSRLTFATIIKPVGKRGIPKFGNYDEDFRKQLQPYIDNLNAATGLIECPQAEKMARQLCNENEEMAELSDDDIFETLSYRASRIAYDKAMLLYIAHGSQWDKSIADFCRWSEQYDMWCKLHFFGQSMREQVQNEHLSPTYGPQNMLDLLTDRFSRQDLQSVHRAQGRDGNVMQLLYTWTNRGYIVQDSSTQEYVKTASYLAKHKSVKG